MSELENSLPSEQDIKKYKEWWEVLSNEWKVAFNEVFQNKTTDQPMENIDYHTIWNTPVIRLAGPKAMHPNMSFELTDLSGISSLINLKILVVIDHGITSLDEIAELIQLESLFAFNNKISSLNGIRKLTELKELCVQNNLIDSLEPLTNLIKLENIICKENKLDSLSGIGKQHSENLKSLFCLPNDLLKDRAIIDFENEVGVRCK